MRTHLTRVATALMFANIAFAFFNVKTLIDYQARTVRYFMIREETKSTRAEAVTVQSSVRGYFMTGNESFLAPCRRSGSKIDESFQHLKALCRDDPFQAGNTLELERSIGEVRRYYREMAALCATEEGLGEAYKHMAANDGTKRMNRVDAALKNIDATEKANMTHLKTVVNRATMGVAVNYALFLVLNFGLPWLKTSAWSIRRDAQ